MNVCKIRILNTAHFVCKVVVANCTKINFMDGEMLFLAIPDCIILISCKK